MKKNKLISIIVPVYNVEKYLQECLESIIQQTYKGLEIIVVDDGSTDSCPSICDEYGARDSRVFVIHKKNGGLSDARNVGIAKASGDYISFVDSDDVLALDMIEYLYDNIEKTNADMSVCQLQRTNELGEFIQDTAPVEDILLNEGTEQCLKYLLTDGRFEPTAWAKLYRADLFESIRYPKGKFNEDIFTTYKVVALCDCIFVGGQRKYFNRIRQGSIMNMPFRPMHMDAIEGKIQQNMFMEENYPNLVKFSRPDIVYAANICSLRIINSGKNYPDYVKRLQGVYREYLCSYLRSTCSLSGKFFAALAFLNLNLLIHFFISFKMRHA